MAVGGEETRENRGGDAGMNGERSVAKRVYSSTARGLLSPVESLMQSALSDHETSTALRWVGVETVRDMVTRYIGAERAEQLPEARGRRDGGGVSMTSLVGFGEDVIAFPPVGTDGTVVTAYASLENKSHWPAHVKVRIA